METALLVLIAAVIGGGVAGALSVTWRLHLRLNAVEDEQQQLRTVATREVKKAAAAQRWNKQDLLEHVARTQQVQPQREVPWWEEASRK